MNTLQISASNKKLNLNNRLNSFNNQYTFDMSELQVKVKDSEVVLSSPILSISALKTWASYFMQNRKYTIK